ncbi:hypothetical protein [Halosegnis marinus]|uniref:Uncharacterized protein n=1 Tax=Halosegnis marinus TaxID=3034023 RepID=A0ABD5ZRW2_9EURY|nr:hypothetical protein [Halosegnis sp. DT85]
MERAHRFARQSLGLQVRTARAAVNSLDEQRTAGRQAVSLFGLALEAPVFAARAAVPGSERPLVRLESAIEEETASLEDAADDWWLAVGDAADDGVESYAAVVESYAAFLDAVFAATTDAAERFGSMDGDDWAGDWADVGVTEP